MSELRTEDELAMELARIGEEWLDEYIPGWDANVDKNTLDMQSFKGCVLGQVFGDYSDRPRGEMPAEPDEMGFDIGYKVRHYEPLDRAWQSILAARRA